LRISTKFLSAILVFLCCLIAPIGASASFFNDIKSLPGQFAEGAAIVKSEVLPELIPASRAGLSGIWQNAICFFGINCPADDKLNDNSSTDNKTQEGFDKGLTSASTREVRPLETQNQANSDQDLTLLENQRVRPSENQPAQIVQNIYPEKEIQTKEIQTVHTREIQTQTQINRVIVDQETKDKVNQLLRQMDTDRPNYSAGQPFVMPANLGGNTLSIASNRFAVDSSGNLIIQGSLSAEATTIAGALSITGGSPGAGKVLTSDADGLATWEALAAYIIDLSAFTTDDLTQGSANLYFPGFTDLATDYGFTDNSTNWNTAHGWGDHSSAGYLTGNQTITLSGDISGSGATTIATAIGAGKVTNDMLAGSIAASKLIGTDITTLGTIGTGIWSGTAIADDKIAAALTGKTYNGLTLAPQATGFTIAGGTTGKTLTINNSLGFSGGDGKTLNIGANNITLTSSGDVALSLPTTGTVTALGNTTTGSGSVVLQTSPSLVTPDLGVATATSINKLAITAPATGAVLTIADGKTFTASNTLTLTGNDGASLAIGAGGTLGTGAYAAIADYAPLASPTFTGTVTMPSPFTLGATSVTATGTQLNYLTGAGGTTGTTNLVFSDSPTLVTPVLGAAIATSLSAPTLTTASGDLTLDPTGNVVIKGSTADNTTAALNITNSTPESLLFARNDGNVGINNILPERKLDIIETTSATPQIRLSYDGSNYGEMYVDSIGNLFMDATGSTAQNISIMDQNLKVCVGGSFGSNTCPTSGFNITGTGNLVVANEIAATDYQRICPTGYIWVPGSAKYGTMPGFCVMKYEAKDVGSVATSQAASTPWTSITQTAARAACRALGAGYHLISENEWMTIADNAANTASNWFGGTVGTNFMYSGHNDNGPATKLAASTDDDGYSGTNDSADSCDGVYNNFDVGDDTTSGRACVGQKRTFTLSNGNVIWDISGNVWEWTDAYIYDSDGTHEMPLPATGWLEYSAVTDYKGLNYIRPQNTSWSATQSIGRIYADPNCAYSSVEGNETCGVGDHYYHAFKRGGYWADGAGAGAFTLYLRTSPTGAVSGAGFRCAR